MEECNRDAIEQPDSPAETPFAPPRPGAPASRYRFQEAATTGHLRTRGPRLTHPDSPGVRHATLSPGSVRAAQPKSGRRHGHQTVSVHPLGFVPVRRTKADVS
jgi:hypothetical protein